MIKPISNKKNQKKIFWIKEAQTGFEPVDTVLQTIALPLGYCAINIKFT